VGTYNPQTGQRGISGQGYGVNFPADISPSDLAIGSSSLGLLVGKIGGNILDMQLTALQSKNLLKILSTPSVSTLDNQMAYTENGEQVPYVSTTSLGGTNVQFVDAVLRLEITPHVISDEYLKLQILVTNDQVDFTNEVDGNPLIVKKQTRTTLICRNGETIVIAGLVQNTTTNTNYGVPGLKDVPILGALFKSNADSQNLEDTLIFITPHVLPELNDRADKAVSSEQ
jgi:type IV pilus assembly protein PilQ